MFKYIEQNKPINGPALRRLTKKGRAETLMDIFNTYIEDNGPLSLPVVSVEPEQEDQPDLPTELADLKSLMIPEVVDQLDAVFNRANQIANAIHNKRVNAEVMEARAKREDAAREVEEANQDLINAYNEIEDLNEDVERLSDSESKLKSQVAQLTEKLNQAERQGEQLEQEVKGCRQNIDDKAGEVKTLQHDLTVATEQISQVTQTLDSERETHKQTLENERTAHRQAQEQAEKILTACQTERQQAQDAHHQAETEKATLAAELKAAYTATEQLKLGHQELMSTKEQQLSQQAGQLEELQQQQDTEKALKESLTQFAELDKSLALALSKADEVPALREKNEAMQEQLLQLATDRSKGADKKN